MAKARLPDERRILCTSCGGVLQVSSAAKSVSCHHCHGRVICEALVLNEYVAVRKLRTANHIHIKKRGNVRAAIWAEGLRVEGRLSGEAVVLGDIQVLRRAEVRAHLRGLSLMVEEGAVLVGEMRIGPLHLPQAASQTALSGRTDS